MNLRIARQRLGLRQSSGAFGWLASIAKAPEDWRTPKPGGLATIHGEGIPIPNRDSLSHGPPRLLGLEAVAFAADFVFSSLPHE